MSFRFIFMTDTHLSNKPPASRLDDYNESVFEKIKFCFQYCIDHEIPNIIHGGDLFHSYKIREEIGIRFIDLLQEYHNIVNFFYCFGNHDVQANNREYVDKTALGFLLRYPQFHVLNNKPYGLGNGIWLNGYDISDRIPPEDMYNWEPTGFYDVNKRNSPNEPFYKILVLHANIEDAIKPLVIKNEQKSSIVNDVTTDANLVLCGHNHLGWENAIETNTLEWKAIFVNPGSIARINYNEAMQGCGPRLADITIKRKSDEWDTKVKFVNIPSNAVFDVEGAKKKKSEKAVKENFLKAFKNLSRQEVLADNLTKVIKETFDNPPKKLRRHFNPRVKKYLNSKLQEVLNE